MAIYTPSKRWVLLGLLLIGLALLTLRDHTVADVISGITTTIGGVAFILLGLGKVSYVELDKDYFIYHYNFKRIKKWRAEEISLITKNKKWDRTTIRVYKGTEVITLFSYNEQFWDHLGRIAKKAKVINE